MSLTSLRDIPGVYGSFLLTPQGELAQRDMPQVYQDSAFVEIGRRLRAVTEAAETVVRGYHEFLAKFNGYWLLSKRTPNGTLNVVAAETVNFPALRMATNVAIRHLTAEPLKPLATPAPEPAKAAPAPAPRKLMAMGRGVVRLDE
jgi:hypothetical protein